MDYKILKFYLIQKLLLLLLCIAGVQSACNVCQSRNNVACHKENQYSLCINGVPTEDFITCPENHMCTSDPYVCLPNATPACIRDSYLCGLCNENKLFACINETTIAFCYGENMPIEGSDVSFCPQDTVCDIFSKKGFCTESYLTKPSCITTTEDTSTTAITETTSSKATTIELTTTTETITTEASTVSTVSTTAITDATSTTTVESITFPTTTSKPFDVNFACQEAGAAGSYYFGDPTCRTYVLCYRMGESLFGKLVTCPSNQFFPPRARFCTHTKPAVCV